MFLAYRGKKTRRNYGSRPDTCHTTSLPTHERKAHECQNCLLRSLLAGAGRAPSHIFKHSAGVLCWGCWGLRVENKRWFCCAIRRTGGCVVSKRGKRVLLLLCSEQDSVGQMQSARHQLAAICSLLLCLQGAAFVRVPGVPLSHWRRTNTRKSALLLHGGGLDGRPVKEASTADCGDCEADLRCEGGGKCELARFLIGRRGGGLWSIVDSRFPPSDAIVVCRAVYASVSLMN